MSDKLKKIYSSANKLDRYCDTKTPCKLYRGLKNGSTVGLMVPTIFGFYKRNEPRSPDVFISDSVSASPQFKTGGDLVTESKLQPLTHEILKGSDKYMVRGCRTMSGEYRGLSLFNQYNMKFPFDWFLISEETNIPKGLAVIRDAPLSQGGMVHYTVAPKDDMPLSLYIVQLNTLGNNATPVRS